MTEREAFEAFWISRYKDEKTGRKALAEDNYGYVTRDWQFWQASRQQALTEAADMVHKGGNFRMALAIRSLTSPIGDKA